MCSSCVFANYEISPHIAFTLGTAYELAIHLQYHCGFQGGSLSFTSHNWRGIYIQRVDPLEMKHLKRNSERYRKRGAGTKQ